MVASGRWRPGRTAAVDRPRHSAGSGSIQPDSRDIPSLSLPAERQAAAPGPVGFVVVAVGVEDLIDTGGDGLEDVGIGFGGFAHQAGLDLVAIGHRHAEGNTSMAWLITRR